eukprot:COSAG05_NODE_2200_length_3407_cov_25.853109_2_plen_59_part_00
MRLSARTRNLGLHAQSAKQNLHVQRQIRILFMHVRDLLISGTRYPLLLGLISRRKVHP